MDIQTATTCMSHLGHRRRLEIIKLLVKTAPNGLTMNEIASHILIPNSTLTHHIKRLEAAGLIERRHEAQSIRCLVKINVLKSLSSFLLQECCGNSNQPC